MSRHYHILVQTPDANLSRSMRHLNGVYTQRYDKRHRCDGHLFKGRYKSIVVESDSYALEFVRYSKEIPFKPGWWITCDSINGALIKYICRILRSGSGCIRIMSLSCFQNQSRKVSGYMNSLSLKGHLKRSIRYLEGGTCLLFLGVRVSLRG